MHDLADHASYLGTYWYSSRGTVETKPGTGVTYTRIIRGWHIKREGPKHASGTLEHNTERWYTRLRYV